MELAEDSMSRCQVKLGYNDIGIWLSLISRVLPNPSQMPNESTTAVGHNGWPCYHLNPTKLAMLYHLRLGSSCIFHQVSGATGVEWRGQQAALG